MRAKDRFGSFMTLDELETVCWREGLTRPQVDAVLLAAGSYATAQAVAALAALGHEPPLVHYLAGAKGACGETNQDLVNTTLRRPGTCSRCTPTRAWKGH